MAISKKIFERIAVQLKRYQSILADAKDRDISESDTVVIIGDMLADVLGYKKYREITTEFAIRGTYVDLAVKVDPEIRFLVEAKAFGVSLKDAHVKQAVDYGANHGVEWIILTNGAIWQIYKVGFTQPISKTLIFEIDLLQTNARNPKLLECFGNLSREGFTQSSMAIFGQQQQATSKFSLAAIVLSDPMLKALKRELKRISPSIKIEESVLKATLQSDVLKREVIESDEAKQALSYLKRANKSATRVKSKPVLISKPQEPTMETPDAPVTEMLV